MGTYHLHITRREFWSYTSSGLDVTPEEWRAIVEADSELSWRPERGPLVAAWTGSGSDDESFLDIEYGNVYAKNPPAPLIDKMVSIARLLGARVQGIDGEIYSGSDKELPPALTVREQIIGWLNRLRKRPS